MQGRTGTALHEQRLLSWQVPDNAADAGEAAEVEQEQCGHCPHPCEPSDVCALLQFANNAACNAS